MSLSPHFSKTLIDQIGRRLYQLLHLDYDADQLEEMIKNVPICARRCRLDVAKLFSFGDDDFLHDMVGITKNMNKKNGRLENSFVPRCTIHPEKIHDHI